MTSVKKLPVMGLSRAISRVFFSTAAAAAGNFPLKHVTRSNFEPALAELRSIIRAADFVAVDLEMTGVSSTPWREAFEFDRYDVSYLKVKDSAEKFAVLQFGVCPFRWDSLKQAFVAHPHNFFVFPRQEIQLDGPAHQFLCQTTSMEFLAKYQFDFNTCINDGISYLSRLQEEEALRRLKLIYDNEMRDSVCDSRESIDIPLASMSDILFTERMKNRLREWHNGLLRNANGEPQEILSDSKQQFMTIFFKMRPALSLSGFTSHQLQLIKTVVKKHFSNLYFVSLSSGSSARHLVVYTDSENDKGLLMKEVDNEYRRGAEMKIEAAVGFRRVIDILSSENKLIVGHNCFLDIAHIYNKFFCPLPSTAEEFVSAVNKYFAYVIDTKIILNADDQLSKRMKKSKTSLSSAFTLLCPEIVHGSKSSLLSPLPALEIEVQVDDMRSMNWNSGAKHEAGYDAFMTGCVFAKACAVLGIDFENLADNEKLQMHINRLYLSWVNGDVIDLRTGDRMANPYSSNYNKRYPKIVFENIVLVWGLPSKLKAREIKECISKVFGATSVASVYHLDETAVFVQFSKAESVSEFLALKETLEKQDDPISVLHPLSKLLEGGSTRAATYETYRDICSSPISKTLFCNQADAVSMEQETKRAPPEVQVEKQEDRSSYQEFAGQDQDVTDKTEKGYEKLGNDPSQKQLRSEEIVHSLGTAEGQQAKASNW